MRHRWRTRAAHPAASSIALMSKHHGCSPPTTLDLRWYTAHANITARITFMFRRWRRRVPSVSQATGPYRHGNRHFIELRQVVKTYQTAAGPFVALRGVDLAIDRGEFVAVVGKSGSGKSTLINMLTGIDRPTQGEVLVGDTAVHTLTEGQMAVWRGHNVGVIFQFFQLLPTLTVIENVMLPMDFCHLYTPRQRRERAMLLLDHVELRDQAHKLPTAISGGQQQRAAIARALANDPPLLVADEPTGNLDSRTADAVVHLFETLVANGKTVVMVTHDTDLAQRAGRAILVADGQIGDGGQETQQLQHGRAAVAPCAPRVEPVAGATQPLSLADDPSPGATQPLSLDEDPSPGPQRAIPASEVPGA